MSLLKVEIYITLLSRIAYVLWIKKESMSHHHRDTEKQTADEKPLRRRHSHHDHSHLKASTVIDHLKTKVRRRRLSKHGSVELSDAMSNQSENTTSNSNTSEPTYYRPTTTMELHPTALETIFSYDGNDDNELNLDSGMFKRSRSNKIFEFSSRSIHSKN